MDFFQALGGVASRWPSGHPNSKAPNKRGISNKSQLVATQAHSGARDAPSPLELPSCLVWLKDQVQQLGGAQDQTHQLHLACLSSNWRALRTWSQGPMGSMPKGHYIGFKQVLLTMAHMHMTVSPQNFMALSWSPGCRQNFLRSRYSMQYRPHRRKGAQPTGVPSPCLYELVLT